MRVAAITDDGVTISQHFGRAPYYLVYTIENGTVVDREMREKMGHAQFVNEPGLEEHGHDHEHDHGHQHGSETRHGYGPAADSRHARMAAAITDCEALLCRGMGWGAYESMKQNGITPIVTDIRDVETAMQAYIDGSIEDLTDKLH